MTRIVAGTAGGRRLAVPPKGTRPTSDRVREALFSALEALVDLDGARVLDLYAGSGALGFESLSRGATTATFVESDRRAGEVLRRNAADLGLPGADVRTGTADTVLSTGAVTPYDVVFADPPYDLTNEALHKTLTVLVESGWTEPGTVVVVERAVRTGDPAWPSPLVPLRTRRYGDTAVHWAEHA
ncbi:16S rRNA (guanine(966)-N(2))-methyltransferase RsmD [Allokutzneria albata]|uniref:16S rRNA (Guanine966-N2)-methyltransferase n=1 Tax=Allokutzneria albata TaxID=211114 RepID=A0A1G9XFN9_ALLAB|nr:16S rRNA (guanine(966)-N(2))-methyltransferase RsmD [Allokutzneria albata]SDM95560.1 16S rRNA (guanine966-N2)-methyltransferase [Allokutzneria albata]